MNGYQIWEEVSLADLSLDPAVTYSIVSLVITEGTATLLNERSGSPESVQSEEIIWNPKLQFKMTICKTSLKGSKNQFKEQDWEEMA